MYLEKHADEVIATERSCITSTFLIISPWAGPDVGTIQGGKTLPVPFCLLRWLM